MYYQFIVFIFIREIEESIIFFQPQIKIDKKFLGWKIISYFEHHNPKNLKIPLLDYLNSSPSIVVFWPTNSGKKESDKSNINNTSWEDKQREKLKEIAERDRDREIERV